MTIEKLARALYDAMDGEPDPPSPHEGQANQHDPTPTPKAETTFGQGNEGVKPWLKRREIGRRKN